MTAAKTEAKVRADCLAYLLELARKRRERLAKEAEQEQQSEEQQS